MSDKKTPEEILKKHIDELALVDECYNHFDKAKEEDPEALVYFLFAMQEYTDQETAPLKQRIEELQKEVNDLNAIITNERVEHIRLFETHKVIKQQADRMAEALELVKAGYNPCIPNGVINELDKALNDYRGIK